MSELPLLYPSAKMARIGWISLALSVALAIFQPRRSFAGEDPVAIAFTIKNALPVERRDEPMTCGIPLPRGFVGSSDELTLLGPGGEIKPVQIQKTGAYLDGSPRWVLLDFQASVPAAATATYRLRKGPRVSPPYKLVYRLDDGVAHIDTGTARFTIDAREFRLLDTVVVDGIPLVQETPQRGFHLRESGPSDGDTRPVTSKFEFEDAGLMAAVLAVHGAWKHDGNTIAKFVCRLRFYAGKSEVRVFYTLHNPAAHRHPGNVWELGGGGSLFMEDFSLLLPMAMKDVSVRVGTSMECPPLAATRLYQDSSGGNAWNSVNHIDKDYRVPTRFRGYRIYKGRKIISRGDRANGWIHARSSKGGVAAGIREFWQNFPKALEYENAMLRIALWPGAYAVPHEILGGEQKTHEILLLFHGAGTSNRRVSERLEAFHHPLYAMPDPKVVFASRTFWPTGPIDRSNHRMLEQTCDTFVDSAGPAARSVLKQWEVIDEFGWRHFGDTFADNERSPEAMQRDFPEHHPGGRPISHYGNEYDVSYAVMLQGLRRGDPRWMWLADVLCRHYADIGIYHTSADPSAAYAHGPFTHTTHNTAAFRSTHRMYPSEAERYHLPYSSGGPNAGHCYVASLAQHYYLTGDRVSREAFLEVADWSIHSPWFTEKMLGDQRAIGNLLMTHIYAYEMTHELRYYTAAVQMVDSVTEPFEGLGANLFVKAAGRFLDLKTQNHQWDDDAERALHRMLAFGDLYLKIPPSLPTRSLEQTCFHAELMFTCYLHAPPDDSRRKSYYVRGQALMEAVRNRWPGTYRPTKTLVMCFANTGAFFRSLWEAGE